MTIDPELLTGLGAASAIFLSCTGAALASSHAGVFAVRSESYRGLLPIVIAGVLAIYGTIVAVLLCGKLTQDQGVMNTNTVDGYRNLSAGLSAGLACWASGYGMALFLQQCNEMKENNKNKETILEQERLPLYNNRCKESLDLLSFPKMFMILVFLEAIGLYGLVLALILMR